MNKPSNRRGFTLIELLVVVAIITALLAILLPSMGRAIELAQAAVCLSNQRQSGMILIEYASDHARVLPPSQAGSTSNPTSWGWELFIKRYAQTPSVLGCSTARLNDGRESGGDLGRWNANLSPTSGDNANQYSIFAMRQGANTGNGLRVPVRLTELRADDNFVLTEALRNNQPHVDFYIADRWHVVYLKHAGRANTWYADGSARPTEADYFEQKVDWGTLMGDALLYGITSTETTYDQ